MLDMYTKKQVVKISQAIIDNAINIVQGCRELDRLAMKNEIPLTDKDFLTFKGIASETDEFPIGDARKHYNAEYLKKLDAELEEYLSTVKPALLKACKNILKKYISDLHS